MSTNYCVTIIKRLIECTYTHIIPSHPYTIFSIFLIPTSADTKQLSKFALKNNYNLHSSLNNQEKFNTQRIISSFKIPVTLNKSTLTTPNVILIITPLLPLKREYSNCIIGMTQHK